MRLRHADGDRSDPARVRRGRRPPSSSAASARSNRTPRRSSTRSAAARRTRSHGMRAVLQSLAGIEGPKSVILISEGLIFEGLGSETDDLAADRRRLARHARRPAARRAAIRRVAVAAADHAARGSRPAGHRASRCSPARRAGRSIASTSAPISRSIASRDRSTAIYLLGVESRPDDRNGRRHRIGVKTHAARRDDPIAAQLPDVDVGEGDDAGRCGDARDQVAAADQRSAAEDCRRGPTRNRAAARCACWSPPKSNGWPPSRSTTRSAWRS